MTDVRGTERVTRGPGNAVTRERPRTIGTALVRHRLVRTVVGQAQRLGSLVALVAIFVYAAATIPSFLTVANVRNLFSQNSELGIVACAMTLAIVLGEFDLSVGAVGALAGIVFAKVAVGNDLWVAGLAALLCGSVCGALNGVLVAAFRVNSFIATLGTASIFSGLAYAYSNNTQIFLNRPGSETLGAGTIGGVPWVVIILACVFLITWIVLSRSSVGVQIKAIGGNRKAARLAGLRYRWVIGGIFVILGLVAALAGVMTTSEVASASADVGSTLALNAIAVVVIGGTSLRGGTGSVGRTVIGLLIVGTLNNIFAIRAVGSDVQLVITGAIIVIAVALDALRSVAEA